MKRRAFLHLAAAGGAALAFDGCALPTGADPRDGSRRMAALLREWGEALLRLQIDDPSQPERHGAFGCPGCGDFIHGRCGDAVYPLLHLARTTGDRRYGTAAVRLMDWTRNVDAPDGAWTNDLDPKSWKGVTVFGVVALGEALGRHGGLLDTSVRDAWAARLRKAADYVHAHFDFDTGNINYPLTAADALSLCGHLFGEERYRVRARELGHGALAYFSEPSGLIFGEGRPATRRTPRGCLPVDLGYNVEESLPALVQYAVRERDSALLRVLRRSLDAHLRFLLPDGGWDNSWGTRNYKWTYWGSRTADGCAPAYTLLAEGRPDFALAVDRNTALLRACTYDGLLHAGPHAAAAGMKPCVHHTFCHAKSLAAVLDAGGPPPVPEGARLPCETPSEVRHFPEIDTWLVSRELWRATVTAYDWFYQDKVWHASGGALSLLWHAEAGPLIAASLSVFDRVEEHNTQPLPGPDVPLTPRIERREDGAWWSNLFDTTATVRRTRDGFEVASRLLNPGGQAVAGNPSCHLAYRIAPGWFEITAAASGPSAHLVVPILSAPGERLRRLDATAVEIERGPATVRIESSTPIQPPEKGRLRDFNNVPGFAAVPLMLELRDGTETRMRIAVHAGRSRSAR